MGHIATRLTESVEIGAVRINPQDGLEIITKDSGRTVRNSRIDEEPIRWEIAIPTVDVEGGVTTDYDQTIQLWRDTERGLHTFDFKCFVDGDVHRVRFESDLSVSAPAGHLRHIDTFTIVEDD